MSLYVPSSQRDYQIRRKNDGITSLGPGISHIHFVKSTSLPPSLLIGLAVKPCGGLEILMEKFYKGMVFSPSLQEVLRRDFERSYFSFLLETCDQDFVGSFAVHEKI